MIQTIQTILFPNEALVDLSIKVDSEFLQQAKGIYGNDMQVGGWHKTDYQVIDQIVKASASTPLMSSGGASSNTAKAIKQLNESLVCRIWSMAGADAYADVYRKAMTDNGVKADLDIVTNCSTGVCLCIVTPDGERTMFTDLGASSHFNAAMIQKKSDKFKEVTITHLEGFSIQKPEFIAECITHAKNGGSLVSIDLCDPKLVKNCKKAFDEVLTENVDILFGNMKTINKRTRLNDPYEMCKALDKHKLVAITDSKNGCYIKGPTGTIVHIPAHPATVVDTSAAGDYFIAGMLNAISKYGILENEEDLKYFGNAANIVAATMCEYQGTDLPKEAWAEIAKKLSLLSPTSQKVI